VAGRSGARIGPLAATAAIRERGNFEG